MLLTGRAEPPLSFYVESLWYCDAQPAGHLTHEFREFSGFSPTAFLEVERPSFNHVRVN